MTTTLEGLVFCPEFTAVNKTAPTKVFREKITPFLLENKVKSILDVGSGPYCLEALYLIGHGFSVDVEDLPAQVARMNKELLLSQGIQKIYEKIPRKKYDAVLCNFVFNVIPYMEERVSLLEEIYNVVKKDGFFISTARSNTAVERECNKGDNNHLDGYLMPRGDKCSFQKGYSREEFKAFLEDNGFNIFNMYTYSGGIVAITQKQ